MPHAPSQFLLAGAATQCPGAQFTVAIAGVCGAAEHEAVVAPHTRCV